MRNQILYKAVVEDNNDPLKLGRVRIRVLGIHTNKKEKSPIEGIPTEELPWAHLIWPANTSAVSGIGNWGVPVQGSWVYCIPEDTDLQRWVVVGSLSSIPQAGPNTNVGFNDPSGEYPEYIGEPDFNRLASNQKIDETIIPIKVREIVKFKVASLLITTGFSSPGADGDELTEPQEPYSAEYPYNKVIETERHGKRNGHIIELDDTPGKERIHVWHKAGTSISVHWNGQMVRKVIHDDYDYVLKNKNQYCHENKTVTIGGNKRQLVIKNVLDEIHGYEKRYVGKNKIEYIAGNCYTWVGATEASIPNAGEFTQESKLKSVSNSGKIDLETVYYENENTQEFQYSPKNSTTYDLKTYNVNDLSNETPLTPLGHWIIKIEQNLEETIKGNQETEVYGTYKVEVTGSRTYQRKIAGTPGDMLFVPHGDFIVAGQKMGYIRGSFFLKELTFGCIQGFSICPILMSPHQFPSRTINVSI